MKFKDLIGKRCFGISTVNKPNKSKIKHYSDGKSDTPEYKEECYLEINKVEYIKQFYMLIGEVNDDIDKYKTILFVSKNESYSYYDNWMIMEVDDDLQFDTEFKYIGEVINEVWTDGYDIDTNFIKADEQKWIDAVGKGKYLAKEDVPYKYVSIKMNIKHIDLTSMYHDCHYPESIWMFI